MPIYEYECCECGQVQEIMQKMSDKPLSKCPHCSGKVQKLISHSTFHLKGSGWYATDYANRNSGANTAETKKPDQPPDQSADKPPSAAEKSSSAATSESSTSDA